MKIFWSWQDDSSIKENRHFIKGALEIAVAALAGEYDLEDAGRPSLDHDTKGVPGAAEIAPILMEKIANSAVFVADVTPVAKTTSGKPIPNANVMIELGWSLNKPGWKRQIYVLNKASGYEPSDLPFDIRGRRVLTYTLDRDADHKIKSTVEKKLSRDLTDAIRLNLAQHREEVAAALPVPGVSAEMDEPSLWAGASLGFSHQDSSVRSQWRSVNFAAGPRVYIRLIPSGWKKAPPDVTAIQNLGSSLMPYAPTHQSGGDFGATKEGFVHYWISSDNPRKTEDATMYFEDTGEFWMVTSSPIYAYAGDKGRGVDLTQVFRAWGDVLRRVNLVFDKYGALGVRRVEVGFTGFKEVRFPGGWVKADQPLPRRPALRFDRIQAVWSDDAQQTFLVAALNHIFRLYGLTPLPEEKAREFVKSNGAWDTP